MDLPDELKAVPDAELSWSYVRSGGPGGQNVNKVASKVELRWKVAESEALAEPVRRRLIEQQKNRINADGELVLTSEKTRDQLRNREDCLAKLAELVRQARYVPKKRRPTKPTAGSQRRRVEAKRRRSGVKATRKPPARDD